MSPAKTRPTVLIVGGGLAGLFCALECKRNGFETTVLESRPAIQTAGEKTLAWKLQHYCTVLINLFNQ